MSSISTTTVSPSISAGNKQTNFPVLSNEAGWRCQGNLWSNLRDICTLLKVPSPNYSHDDEVLFQHVRFKAGQRIHTIGQHFDSLFIVNSGFLKTVLVDEYGSEQVLSFPMKGDLLGIDGIYT